MIEPDFNFQCNKGIKFESDTDTESVVKLTKHIYDNHPCLTFQELVERVCLQLVSLDNNFLSCTDLIYLEKIFKEGAYALVFKSVKYPAQCVATRRGSPLLIGIKTKSALAYNYVSVVDSNFDSTSNKMNSEQPSATEITPLNDDGEIEYFFASDASAFIEYTKQTVYLQDDDVACIANGSMLKARGFIFRSN